MLKIWSVFSLVDLKAQPDPSPILSQLTQQQNSTLQSDLPAQGRNPSPPLPLQDISSPVLKPLGETSSPTITESHQPKQIRPQRRRMPPPSKVWIWNVDDGVFFLSVNTVHFTLGYVSLIKVFSTLQQNILRVASWWVRTLYRFKKPEKVLLCGCLVRQWWA